MSDNKEKNEGFTPSNTPPLKEMSSKPKSQSFQQHEGQSFSLPTNVSMKSDMSLLLPVNFRQQSVSPEPAHFSESHTQTSGSMERDPSTDLLFNFELEEPFSKTPEDKYVSSVDKKFKLLEKELTTFMQKKLEDFQRILCKKWLDEEEIQGDEVEQRRTHLFLKLTLDSLRQMNEADLAQSLEERMLAAKGQRKLKSNLKKKCQNVLEGIVNPEKRIPLNQVYTELFITLGGTEEVRGEHEISVIEKASRNLTKPEETIRYEDIFTPSQGQDKQVRTVITKGVAGIGKTVLTQRFTLDWAEGKTNQDIQFTFLFSFRELNVLKEKQFSLVELVHSFFCEIKDISIFEEFQVLFIFDGLDESRFPLNFNNRDTVTDVTQSTTLDTLLINLIEGKLLPSARVWITTRPAAAHQIPPDWVDMVTEVRGFTNPRKEEYFKKRFEDKELANKIISHIKATRSLHIMCHIPIFCWITATVLEDAFKTREKQELPKSLTEMYVYFLVVLCKMKKVKYDDDDERAPLWSSENRKMVQSLGKLAFEQLMKGNLFFYESDLAECGINIKAAAMYSGVFTEIFRSFESTFYSEKVFSFVHMSVQEFFAALHVHLMFVNNGEDLLSEGQSTSKLSSVCDKTELFYQNAVDKALLSSNGHLDLVLCFLLGLSQQSNQIPIRGLVTQTQSSSNQKTIQYIKKKLNEKLVSEKSINLFYCLNELKDNSLMQEIQQYLRSGILLTAKLSLAQWSALVFVLLSSEQSLDVFDLKKYSASKKALLRLMPVVKASTKAELSGCNLSKESCEVLAKEIVCSQSSRVRQLDLSNNELGDSGVKLLCEGLKSPNCTLEILRLSGCLVTKDGCASLASTLTSNSSLKELDLSYNHPGDSGLKLLNAACCGRINLKVDHCEAKMSETGLKKYACKLALDPNTAHRNLKISKNKRKVTLETDEQPYPDQQESFDHWYQVICKHALSTTDRCYWEVEFEGVVHVAVTYKGISRKGAYDDSCLGRNDQSWSLKCTETGWSLLHNNRRTSIFVLPSKRVGVYLDWPASTLSFYSVSSSKVTHLHTFNSEFTEPLYPAFRIKPEQLNSSVSLCKI